MLQLIRCSEWFIKHTPPCPPQYLAFTLQFGYNGLSEHTYREMWVQWHLFYFQETVWKYMFAYSAPSRKKTIAESYVKAEAEINTESRQTTIIKYKVIFWLTNGLNPSKEVCMWANLKQPSLYGPFLPTVDELWRLPNSPLNVSISQHCGNGVIKMGATGTPRWAIVPYAFHLRHRNLRQAHGHNSHWLGVSIATLEAGLGVGLKNRNLGVFFALLTLFF